MPPAKNKTPGKFKGIKNKRQGEIYDYFRRQLFIEKNAEVLEGNSKPQREFIVNSLYKTSKLSKQERNLLLRQTATAYREEIADQESQLRYYKDKIGSRNKGIKQFIRSEQFKYFFPEKGEHKELFKRIKEFEAERKQILTDTKGQRVKNRTKLLEIYQRLYQKSPWRLRDRFLIPTGQKGESQDMDQIWRRYYKDNPFTATKKYYFQAIAGWQNSTQTEGELVPDNEIELDKYGRPRFKEGQVISLTSSKPGRSWGVYKNVPSWEEQEKRKIHDVAHEKYITNEGSALEIQTWKMKKNKALCWIEAVLGQSCVANQGTSGWWCLFCIAWGSYHPPVLPKHCPWLYTYKTWLCGTKGHSDANKQWHFSVEGERIRDAIRGGDWGSCHIGTFDKKKLKKQKRK